MTPNQMTAKPPVEISIPSNQDPTGPSSSCCTGEGILNQSDTFADRHLGPGESDIAEMLKLVGYDSLDALTDATIPAQIRLKDPISLTPPRCENELIKELRIIAEKNKINRSFIGMGYYGTITPPVIQRNILENPGWYTQYTPYQAEIAQGRLEALINFQDDGCRPYCTSSGQCISS